MTTTGGTLEPAEASPGPTSSAGDPTPSPGGRAAPPPSSPGPQQLVSTTVATRESLGRFAARWAIATAVVVTVTTVLLSVSSLLGTVALLGAAGAAAGVSEAQPALPTTFVAGEEGASDRILAVPVSGVILGEGQSDSFAFLDDATYGQEISDTLAAAAEDKSIKAVVLEMDTPGGTVFGAEAIAKAVEDYRETTGNPVVAYVAGMSASGGMWSMAGADRIVAAPGTSIGSIGVIAGPLYTYTDVVGIDGGLLFGGVDTRGGITSESFSAGEGKSFGDPFRPVTEREREVFQAQVDVLYEDFVDHVSQARGIPGETIVNQIGAHLYTAQVAVTLGLADELGCRDEAYAVAAELAALDPEQYAVARVAGDGGPLSAFGLLRAVVGGAGSAASSGGESVAPGGSAVSEARDPATVLCAARGAPLVYQGDLTAVCAP